MGLFKRQVPGGFSIAGAVGMLGSLGADTAVAQDKDSSIKNALGAALPEIAKTATIYVMWKGTLTRTS